jgi:hypothetical protein
MEEHYFSPAFVAGPGKNLRQSPNPNIIRTIDASCDVGAGRIELMDRDGIDVQILSHGPGIEQLEPGIQLPLVRETNDFLREACARFPGRLYGFASVPTAAPDEAPKELERMMRAGFRGSCINGHSRGRYLDDRVYWPFLEASEAFEAPLYLHPTPPPKGITDIYYAGFSTTVTHVFSTSCWGWHIETAVHALRLILAGVFDEFPRLQVVIGHTGEALSFMLPRMDQMLRPEMTGLKHPVSHYLRHNFHYTFSGFNFLQNFINLSTQVDLERIMFSVDYPYQDMAAAVGFLHTLPVTPAAREQIAHGNAERLFKL